LDDNTNEESVSDEIEEAFEDVEHTENQQSKELSRSEKLAY
jgi:hypothetical protein